MTPPSSACRRVLFAMVREPRPLKASRASSYVVGMPLRCTLPPSCVERDAATEAAHFTVRATSRSNRVLNCGAIPCGVFVEDRRASRAAEVSPNDDVLGAKCATTTVHAWYCDRVEHRWRACVRVCGRA